MHSSIHRSTSSEPKQQSVCDLIQHIHGCADSLNRSIEAARRNGVRVSVVTYSDGDGPLVSVHAKAGARND